MAKILGRKEIENGEVEFVEVKEFDIKKQQIIEKWDVFNEY